MVHEHGDVIFRIEASQADRNRKAQNVNRVGSDKMK